MGASGVDVLLSEGALAVFPYSVECKNRARIAVYADYEQAKSNSEPNTFPVLVIKQNHSEPLVVVDLEHFMELTEYANMNNPLQEEQSESQKNIQNR